MLRLIYPFILAIAILTVSFGCGKRHDETPFGWEEDWISWDDDSIVFETIPIPQIDWKATLKERPYLKEIVDSVIEYYMKKIADNTHETQEQWEARVEEEKRFLEKDSPLPYYVFEMNYEAEELLSKCRLLDEIMRTMSNYFQLSFMVRYNTLEEDIENFKHNLRIEIRFSELNDSIERIYAGSSRMTVPRPDECVLGGVKVDGFTCLLINTAPDKKAIRGIITYPDSVLDMNVFYIIRASCDYLLIHDGDSEGPLYWEYEVCNGKLHLKYFGN